MSYITYEVMIHSDGAKQWRLNGKLHREDGHAVESAGGAKYWYLNGQYHRADGPSCEWTDGTKIWHLNGKLHREDGPAREWAGGMKEWWVDGKNFTEEEFNARNESCEGKVVEINGKKYQLKELK